MEIRAIATLLTIIISGTAGAEDAKDQVTSYLDEHREDFSKVAMDIWEFAEVGYQEEKSSKLLQSKLQAAGFDVEADVAGMPTAFIGSWGEGKPVIAILAEYDALPGLSQQVATERKEADGTAGHACGHHLFGTASTAAAIAVKDWLQKSGTSGTIRLYGTPAEEGGAGKVYMVREGLFEDVDVSIAWHPGDRNDASPVTSLANISTKFRFYGRSAHAAGAPEQGRSALDAVEALNYMVNLMREHVDSTARIHYVITRGGDAPNVVPDFAEVYYYTRHPDVEALREIWERVHKAAEGAALGTGTRMEYEIIHGIYAVNPNETVHRLFDKNLRASAGVVYTEEETAFAEKIQTTLAKPKPIGSQTEVLPWKPSRVSSSSDVADVSWVVPYAEFYAATWVPGTPSHSWQAVASGGTSIGLKGMAVAAKTLAMTAVDIFEDPSIVEKAKQELQKAQGPDFKYVPLLGDREPPLDYRK
jgi:aminobenzoyl-glutamate utilization protein B